MENDPTEHLKRLITLIENNPPEALALGNVAQDIVNSLGGKANITYLRGDMVVLYILALGVVGAHE